MNAILNAEIDCICFFITGILLFWMGKSGIRSFVDICLSRLLICFLFCFALNFLFVLFNGIVVLKSALALSYILKTLFFITLTIGVFIWCIYADAIIDADRKLPVELKWFLLVAPAVVPVVAAFMNLNTHQLFLINEESGVYTYGPWFQYLLLYLFFFAAIQAVRLLLHVRKELEPSAKFNLLIAAVFPLSLLLTWVLIQAGREYPVLSAAVTLALLLLFMGNTMQQVSVDTLTQVNNRQNLMGFLTLKLKDHKKDIYLMMIDLDHFKTINDNYGHVEGDKALKYASASVKTACGNFVPRPYIARYGGDEFIVVLETDNSDDTVEIAEAIRNELSTYNETLPYKLSLSIGVAKHHDDQTPKELIHEADLKLYDIKQERDARER